MRRTAGVVVLGLVLLLAVPRLAAAGQGATQQLLRHSRFIVNEYTDGDFPLAYQGRAADLYIDPDDQPGVARALAELKSDIAMVTGLEPVIKTSPDQLGP
ncbi:MAG: hypothetical protein QM399_04180, partial [Bacillota bacterium]|nr:hypothetical protein [Bacillota bacterium]